MPPLIAEQILIRGGILMDQGKGYYLMIRRRRRRKFLRTPPLSRTPPLIRDQNLIRGAFLTAIGLILDHKTTATKLIYLIIPPPHFEERNLIRGCL